MVDPNFLGLLEFGARINEGYSQLKKKHPNINLNPPLEVVPTEEYLRL